MFGKVAHSDLCKPAFAEIKRHPVSWSELERQLRDSPTPSALRKRLCTILPTACSERMTLVRQTWRR